MKDLETLQKKKIQALVTMVAFTILLMVMFWCLGMPFSSFPTQFVGMSAQLFVHLTISDMTATDFLQQVVQWFFWIASSTTWMLAGHILV